MIDVMRGFSGRSFTIDQLGQRGDARAEKKASLEFVSLSVDPVCVVYGVNLCLEGGQTCYRWIVHGNLGNVQ
jgi:hypothetical protein